MLDSGQNMKSIQEWLGHASYSTTANLYTHLTAGVKERAAEALKTHLGLKNKNKNKNNIFVVSFLVLEFFRWQFVASMLAIKIHKLKPIYKVL